MKIIYKEGTRKTLAESTEEVRSTVATALELVEGKHGFRTPFEIWHNCKLVITIGHNIYTTSIEIHPPVMAYIKRRSNCTTDTLTMRPEHFGEITTTRK